MASYNKFQAFVEHLAEKVHDLGNDQLRVALTNAANAPVAGDSVLADLTEITYTNLSARDITTSSSSQTGGTYSLVVNDLVLTSSGGTTGPFRYVVVYNDTPTSPADPLVAWFDNGSEITLSDGGPNSPSTLVPRSSRWSKHGQISPTPKLSTFATSSFARVQTNLQLCFMSVVT